jgi:asparagine N-glycosylation enzyme membrane subunit Stt3
MLTGTIDTSRTKIRKRSWTSLAVAVIVLVCSLLVVLQPIDILVRHLKDDSFYYLKTANNIALGLGSTFDGINQTNGYHPLWMLNLIPIYWIIPRSPFVALRVVVIIIAIYHTLAAVMLYYLVSRLHNNTLGVITSLAWALSPFVLRIDLNGMESALYALLLTLRTSRIAILF